MGRGNSARLESRSPLVEYDHALVLLQGDLIEAVRELNTERVRARQRSLASAEAG